MKLRSSVFAGVLVVAGAGSLLGACSSSSPGASDQTTSPHVTTTTSSVPGFSTKISVPGSTTPPFSEATNARQDVTTSACVQNSASLWALSGTVTNRSSDSHTYTIIVDWVDAGDTVQQSKIVTVPSLAAGKTLAWSASGAAGLKDIRCVIRSARLS